MLVDAGGWTLGDAMRCHAMPCYAMSCHVTPCLAMRCYTVPCHEMGSRRAPVPESVVLQTDPATLKHLTDELEAALKETKTPHYR